MYTYEPAQPLSAEEAVAAYRALPAQHRAVVDAWIQHAVKPAGRFYPVTRAEFEELVPSFYLTADEFNGALIAHGYQPRDPKRVRYATSFKACTRREVQAATYERATAPRWLPQVQALAQTTMR
jgi:hypothetical protein